MAIRRLPNNRAGKSRLAKPPKDKVVSIFKSKPLYPMLVLCLGCGYVRFASIRIRDIRSVECPRCHSRKSFSAFIPRDYFKAFLEEYGTD